jgi:hypothetical protein
MKAENEVIEQPSVSFRTQVEEMLEKHHGRLSQLEDGAGQESGDSVRGLLRTFEARITQVETVQADNTSAILRVSESFQKQLETQAASIADLQAQLSALQPKKE